MSEHATPPLDAALLRRAGDALRDARRVGVLTGAGMSVASGLPTYRGIGGLYNGMHIEEGMPIEDILHARTFARNPRLTWKYIALIERTCRGAVPNEGHHILARWEQRCDVVVVTQNVDGLHRAAGSRAVIELHGNLAELHCCDCARAYVMHEFDDGELPPRCRACDGLVRPNVVLFGELLPVDALARYEHELARGFDVILCIGTSAGFAYIHEPVSAARARGISTIEINPDDTPLSALVDIRLAGAALDVLRALEHGLREA